LLPHENQNAGGNDHPGDPGGAPRWIVIEQGNKEHMLFSFFSVFVVVMTGLDRKHPDALAFK